MHNILRKKDRILFGSLDEMWEYLAFFDKKVKIL